MDQNELGRIILRDNNQLCQDFDEVGRVFQQFDANGKTTSKTYNQANGLIDLLITDDGKLQDIDYDCNKASQSQYNDNHLATITDENFNSIVYTNNPINGF